MKNMQLSFSNLAWPTTDDDASFNLLRSMGVCGLEVAPTRIAGWDQLTAARLSEYRRKVSDKGLVVSSLQAIFYGKPEAQLLGPRSSFDIMLHHVRKIGSIRSVIGGGIAVFGAPRNRLRGDMAISEAWKLAAERLVELGDVAREFDLVIGLEPVAPDYGCDFLTTAPEVIRMVKEVRHPNIRVHLDTACVWLTGLAIADAIDDAGVELLGHFHIAEPDLGGFERPKAEHREAAVALRTIGYKGWLSIEMSDSGVDANAAIRAAIEFAAKTYEYS